jgi:hypothetical protein
MIHSGTDSQSKKPEKYTYSGLTAAHMQRILQENNVKSKGKIIAPSMEALLTNLSIPDSFFEQLDICMRNNVRSVNAPQKCELMGRLKVGARR